MAGQSSTLDTAAFVKWQLPQEFDAPVPNARRQQLKEEFHRNFGPETAGRPTVNADKKVAKKPQSKTAAQVEGKSTLKVALATQRLPEFSGTRTGVDGVSSHVLARAQQLAQNASPSELSVVRRALKLMPGQAKGRTEGPAADVGKECCTGIGTTAKPHSRISENAAEVRATPTPLTHIRQLSPGSRANRWQFTSWHGMQQQETKRSKATAPPTRLHELQPASTGHYRIHPEWGWDA